MFVIKLFTRNWESEKVVAVRDNLEDALTIYNSLAVEDFNLTANEIDRTSYIEKAIFKDSEIIESQILKP